MRKNTIGKALLLLLGICLCALLLCACDTTQPTKSTQDSTTTQTHNYTYASSIVEPTCTEEGYTLRFCACGASIRDTFTEPLGHVFSHVEKQAATCTQDGHVAYWHCERCGKDFDDKDISLELADVKIPAAHTFGAWETVTEANCQTDGSERRTCTICGEPETRTVVASGHIYSSEWSYDSTSHWRAAVCEHTDQTTENAAHTFDHSDCCTVCGYDRTEPTSNDYFVFTLLDDDTYEIRAKDRNDLPQTISLPGSHNGKPVTRIGSFAFYECVSLTSVIIPESVTSIDEYAFYCCYKLAEVYNRSNIPIKNDYDNGYVGRYAMNIYTPEHGTSMLVCDDDGYLFYEDGSTVYLLGYTGTETALTLPSNCHGKNYAIYNYAFRSCTSLTSVTIPEGVTYIWWDAFHGCTSLTDVTIPGSVACIDNRAFEDCSHLANISIANGVETIGASAFFGCYSLASITIPDSVRSIGQQAFGYCSGLSSICIPQGVTEIDNAAFFNCRSLADVTVNENNKYYRSINGNLYSKDGKTLLQYAIGKTAPSFDVPNGVTSIGENAFCYCTSLAAVTIPQSVISIGDDAFTGCYKLVEVYNCSPLTITKGSYSENGAVGYYALNIYTPASGESHLTRTDDGYLFYEDGDTVCLLGHYGTATALTLPENFNGKKYTIAPFAFYRCLSLTSIIIPDGVTSIGRYAFYHCDLLASITIGKEIAGIGEYVFAFCNALTEVNIPGNVKSIGQNAFSSCRSLASVILSDGVTSIGQNAFSSCVSLTSIVIPAGVTRIDSYAFFGCLSLENITVDAQNEYYRSVDGNLYSKDGKTLLQYAIGKTDASFAVPVSVESIGAYAFAYSNFLTDIALPDSVTSIGDSAFFRCASLASIVIPSRVTSIRSLTFAYCTSLTTITISSNVISIGYRAFYGCSSLASVSFDAPDGWVVSRSSVVSPVDVSDPTLAAAYLKAVFDICDWTRN